MKFLLAFASLVFLCSEISATCYVNRGGKIVDRPCGRSGFTDADMDDTKTADNKETKPEVQDATPARSKRSYDQTSLFDQMTCYRNIHGIKHRINCLDLARQLLATYSKLAGFQGSLGSPRQMPMKTYYKKRPYYSRPLIHDAEDIIPYRKQYKPFVQTYQRQRVYKKPVLKYVDSDEDDDDDDDDVNPRQMGDYHQRYKQQSYVRRPTSFDDYDEFNKKLRLDYAPKPRQLEDPSEGRGHREPKIYPGSRGKQARPEVPANNEPTTKGLEGQEED